MVMVNGRMKTMTVLHSGSWCVYTPHSSLLIPLSPRWPHPHCNVPVCVWRTSRPAGLSQTQSHSTLITLRAVSTLHFNNTPCQLHPTLRKIVSLEFFMVEAKELWWWGWNIATINPASTSKWLSKSMFLSLAQNKQERRQALALWRSNKLLKSALSRVEEKK